MNIIEKHKTLIENEITKLIANGTKIELTNTNNL